MADKCVSSSNSKHMISTLQERSLKEIELEQAHTRLGPALLRNQLPLGQEGSYYSLLIRAVGEGSAFTAVVKNDRADTLRISLVNMTVYACYLYAVGLPADFPVDRILVLGGSRAAYIPDKGSDVPDLYSYELVVPATTDREEYQQRILNDLDAHFQLEVRSEMLHIVKGSRAVAHLDHEDVEIIWGEQLMMIMKSKKGAKVDKSYPLLAENN
ncbi:hypothetical protein KO02_01520 [Sphingobacterium sp. ML3W]|nr:hypothetical protein KO02_01520 [Sphingobacterium sp. ML3W]